MGSMRDSIVAVIGSCAVVVFAGGMRWQARAPALGGDWQDPVDWQAAADLDGNGSVDSVSVLAEYWAGSSHVTVVVDTFETSYSVHSRPGRIWIADVDTSDNFREVAVWDPGPSDDYSTRFFRYDGSRVWSIGVVPGLEVYLDGSGVVHGERRGNILHTWHCPALYRVGSRGALEFICEPFYPMITKVRLIQDCPFYEERDREARTRVFRAGTVGIITWTDDKEWCRFDSLDGPRGWFLIEKGLLSSGEEPRAIFDGLSFAD
jgi:hypothetical protein